MYRTLDPAKLIETLQLLERRIGERFPSAGLVRVCAELITFVADNRAKIAAISRPNVALRLSIAAVLAAGLGLIGYVATLIDIKRDAENLYGVLQGIDALFSILIVLGAALLFLVTVEERIKRRRALKDLHELRSIVHVIDMHQLTKDPSTVVHLGHDTPSSPRRSMSPYELMRYLDYCSEMLSLSAKSASLYAQSLRDPAVLNAVNDIEQLTAALSQKIWQKIVVLQGTGGLGPPERDMDTSSMQEGEPPPTAPLP